MKADPIPPSVKEAFLPELAAFLGVPTQDMDHDLLDHLWSLARPAGADTRSSERDLLDLEEFVMMLTESAHSPASLQALEPRVKRFVSDFARVAVSVDPAFCLPPKANTQTPPSVVERGNDNDEKKKTEQKEKGKEKAKNTTKTHSEEEASPLEKSPAVFQRSEDASVVEGKFKGTSLSETQHEFRGRGPSSRSSKQVLQRFGVTALSSGALAGSQTRGGGSCDGEEGSVSAKKSFFNRVHHVGASCLCLGVEHGVFGVCLKCGRIRCQFDIPPSDYSDPLSPAVLCLFCNEAIMPSAKLPGISSNLENRKNELTQLLSALEADTPRGAAETSDILETKRSLKETEDYLRALELHRRLVTFDVEARARTQVLDAASCWFDASMGRAGDSVKDIWLTPSQRQEHSRLVQHLQDAFAARRGKVLVSFDFEKRTITEEQDSLPEEAAKLLEAFTRKCQQDNQHFGVEEKERLEKDCEDPLCLPKKRGGKHRKENFLSAAAVVEGRVRNLREEKLWPSLAPSSEKAEGVWQEEKQSNSESSLENDITSKERTASDGAPLLQKAWHQMVKTEEQKLDEEETDDRQTKPSSASKLKGFARLLYRDLHGVTPVDQTSVQQTALAFDGKEETADKAEALRGRWLTGALHAKLEQEAAAAQREEEAKAGQTLSWAVKRFKEQNEQRKNSNLQKVRALRTRQPRTDGGTWLLATKSEVGQVETDSTGSLEGEEEEEEEEEEGENEELTVWQEDEPLTKEERAEMDAADKGFCLTIRQPFASLVVFGIKTLEFRDWQSSHVGRLWIHAAGDPPSEGAVAGAEEFFTQEMLCGELTPAEVEVSEDSKFLELRRRLLPPFPNRYPTGCVVGCVWMSSCEPIPNPSKKRPSFAFKFEKPQRLPVPVKTPGNKRLWRLPDKLLIHIQDSLLPVRRPRLLAFSVQTDEPPEGDGISQKKKENEPPSGDGKIECR